MLLVMQIMLELSDEYVPFLDKNDPSYATRMDGLKMVENGTITAFNGYILTITEDTIYDSSEYDILARYLDAHGAFFIDRFEGEVKREFELRLEKIADSHENQSIREAACEIISR